MTEIENTHTDWQGKFLVAGALIGALVGLGTAYLLAKTAEEELNGPPQISTTDALKAGVSVVGMVRGIASLAKHKK